MTPTPSSANPNAVTARLFILHWLANGRWTRFRRGASLPVLGLVAWWAAFRFHWTKTTFYVSIGQVVEAGQKLSANGELWTAIGSSLLRLLIGFGLGLLAGVVLGTVLGVSRPARRLLEPTLRVPAGISTFAWIPLIIAWFGLGDGSKIAFIAIAAFFPVLINTLEGIAGISSHWLEVARVFRFSRWQVFSRVILPAALPSIFNGVYLALIVAWGAALAAEYLMTSSNGVGRLLIEGQEGSAMDQAILAAVVAGAIGFALHWLAARLEAWLLRWRAPVVSRSAATRSLMDSAHG